MLISLTGAFRNYEPNYGYGVAADNIVKGLIKNEINYAIAEHSAEIEIFWGHPPYEFSRHGAYKIGYTAWESTELKRGWLQSMQDCDEIWTPSQWLSDLFAEKTGLPTFTYPHGVDKDWKPLRRYRPSGQPFRFLHIGEPQFRKNGQMVVEAFVELFGNNPDYQLIMKSAGINTTRIYSNPSRSIIGTPDGMFSNIIFIDSLMEKHQLIELHNKCHAMVYPSAGEGFGFHPLEAAASAMPTISTTAWADYSEFISCPVESELSESPWQELHPGMMFNPSKESLKEAMLDMVENYEKHSKQAFKNSFEVHKKWNWDAQNYKAAEKIKNIYFSRIMNK